MLDHQLTALLLFPLTRATYQCRQGLPDCPHVEEVGVALHRVAGPIFHWSCKLALGDEGPSAVRAADPT